MYLKRMMLNVPLKFGHLAMIFCIQVFESALMASLKCHRACFKFPKMCTCMVGPSIFEQWYVRMW